MRMSEGAVYALRREIQVFFAIGAQLWRQPAGSGDPEVALSLFPATVCNRCAVRFESSEGGIGCPRLIDNLAPSEALPAFLHFALKLAVKLLAPAVLVFPFLKRETR